MLKRDGITSHHLKNCKQMRFLNISQHFRYTDKIIGKKYYIQRGNLNSWIDVSTKKYYKKILRIKHAIQIILLLFLLLKRNV